MLIAVLADIPARLVRIIAMKIESVGSGREGFYYSRLQKGWRSPIGNKQDTTDPKLGFAPPGAQ
jgi:hypothetical protein